MDADGDDNKRMPAERELVVTRVVPAPRGLVFKLWTRPDHLVHWWGPRGFSTPYLRMDVRAGQPWRACLRSDVDGAEFWMGGSYRELAKPERLVFSFAWDDDNGADETLVTVVLADEGGNTRMTVRHVGFASAAARNESENGWSSCLDRLAEYQARIDADTVMPALLAIG